MTKRTIEQQIALKEAQLAKLKERIRRERSKRLILLGVVAEKVAVNNVAFNSMLIDVARQNLSAADFDRVGFIDRYGNLAIFDNAK